MVESRIDALLAKIKDKPLYPYGWLAIIIVLASVLRCYKLGQWSLWIDEIYTINRAQIHFSDPVYVLQNIANILWLPVSVILTNVFLNTLGIQEWSARLAPALIGIISIPILFVVTRRIWGAAVALIFALLLALSPWHLFWSQNARFYTALMLLYALAAFCLYLAVEHNRPLLFAGFYILFYFALSERMIAVFILPVFVVYLFCLWVFRFDRPPGLNRRNLLVFTAPILLVGIVEIIRFALTGYSLTSDFVQVFGDQQFDDPIRLFIAIIYNIGLPVMALGTLAGLYLWLKRSRAGLFLFIGAVLPIMMLVALNPFLFTKDRYVFVTLPFWLILVALAIKELYSRTSGIGRLLAVGMLAMLLADAAGSIILYYQVNNGNRRDWRAAFEIIQNQGRSDDIVVMWWPEFGPYYLEGQEILPYRDVNINQVENSRRRYWFVMDSETVWGNLPLKHWIEQNGQLINILYLRLPEDDFNLKVYLYDPDVRLVDH